MTTRTTPFARFFRSVEGHLVSRYGTATKTTSNQLIGARRTTKEIPGRENDLIREAKVEWTNEVAALTYDEAERFSREYDRAVKEGALVECTEADYLAYVACENARSAEASAPAAPAEEPAEARDEAPAP